MNTEPVDLPSLEQAGRPQSAYVTVVFMVGGPANGRTVGVVATKGLSLMSAQAGPPARVAYDVDNDSLHRIDGDEPHDGDEYVLDNTVLPAVYRFHTPEQTQT